VTDVPGGHERAILAESGRPPGPDGEVPGQQTGTPAPGGDLPPSAAGVLADRIAASLVHHEPGWRLPRLTALARRYNVSIAEISAAVDELAVRHLLRRLPDGQLYRASPAEYLIPLEGVAGLVSHLDPMGGQLTCRSRQVSWRRVPEDIGCALGIPPSESVCVVRLVWTANGEPAALVTTYLAGLAGPLTLGYPAQAGGPEQETSTAAGLDLLPLAALPGQPGQEYAGQVMPGRPGALRIEMQLPPRSVAKSLRLPAGQPAAIITVRFDDPKAARPAALTIAAVRPDLFRIVIEPVEPHFPAAMPAGSSQACTHVAEDWKS
jgi:hypothetical protein